MKMEFGNGKQPMVGSYCAIGSTLKTNNSYMQYNIERLVSLHPSKI